MSDIKYFDIHTHIFPDKIAEHATRNLGAFYDFVCEGTGTSGDLYESSVRNGVRGALLLCTATNARQMASVNAYAVGEAERLKALGFDARVFACYHQDCADPAAAVHEAEEYGIRGFKIHPDIQAAAIDDPRFFELYRLCEGKMTVYFHMGDYRPQYPYSQIERLLRVREKFPGLRIGAAHLGSYTVWEDSHLLSGIDNIWFDTSSSLWALEPGRASEIIHMLGTDRCMFGTDYPVKRADSEMKLFAALDLSDKERENVAYGNAMKFLEY